MEAKIETSTFAKVEDLETRLDLTRLRQKKSFQNDLILYGGKKVVYRGEVKNLRITGPNYDCVEGTLVLTKYERKSITKQKGKVKDLLSLNLSNERAETDRVNVVKDKKEWSVSEGNTFVDGALVCFISHGETDLAYRQKIKYIHLKKERILLSDTLLKNIFDPLDDRIRWWYEELIRER